MPSLEIELLFKPIRLAFLIFWFYLCMYLVQKFEFSPLTPKKFKPYSNMIMLIAGPCYLLVLFVIYAFKKAEEQGITFLVSALRIFGKAAEAMKRQKHHAGSRGQASIVLLDSSGKDFSQVYGGDGKDANTQDTLHLTESIIAEGLDLLASDILIDPVSESGYDIRFRVDGMLRTVHQINFEQCAAVVSSIKAISGMDIAEKRRPQDGAFVAKTEQGTVSFRVASAGTLHGEKLSIRILNLAIDPLSLVDVGLSESHRKLLLETIHKQSGMILLCGPTGSGKSTTLQAMLRKIDFSTRNVITIEDPIEYILPQASQIEINPKADITFAKTLRSVLRQDPDVISIGEIRDEETADIALQASQTGHLVFATLHSGSNAATLVRLIDLGIKPLLLSSALDVIISQRLLRKLCDNCKKTADLTDTQIAHFQKRKIAPKAILQSKGCPNCAHTGYRGRIGIFDIMVLDDNIKAMITDGNFSAGDLKKHGDAKGRTNLQKQAMKLALAGITSLAEVKRVTSNL